MTNADKAPACVEMKKETAFLFSSADCKLNKAPLCQLKSQEINPNYPCYYKHKLYRHGERVKSVGKCVDGSILFDCIVKLESNVTKIQHGDITIMEDKVERQCDDGVMKPLKCKCLDYFIIEYRLKKIVFFLQISKRK